MPEQEHTEAVQSETPENKTPGKTESPAETSAETPVRAETQSDELNGRAEPARAAHPGPGTPRIQASGFQREGH